MEKLTTEKEARTGNMGLASCGVKCLNSNSVFQINYSAGLTVLCPEIPHERQAQNRYAQCQRDTLHKMNRQTKHKIENQRYVKLKEVQANAQNLRFCTTFNFTPTHPSPPTKKQITTMGLTDIFWKGYYLAKNPNKTYQKGWDDAINGNPRHQYKLTMIFEQYKKTQELYDKGYNDGLKEKLIRKL